MRNLGVFQSLCGQEALENVLLTTTQWSNVDPAEGQAREDNIRHEDFWGGLISRGATLQRFHGTRESGLELISKLMLQERKPLRIQDQIVNQKMALHETDAGKFLKAELVIRERRLKAELEYLEKEVCEPTRARDDGMNQTLGAELARARGGLREVAAERKLLEGLHAAG